MPETVHKKYSLLDNLSKNTSNFEVWNLKKKTVEKEKLNVLFETDTMSWLGMTMFCLGTTKFFLLYESLPVCMLINFSGYSGSSAYQI